MGLVKTRDRTSTADGSGRESEGYDEVEGVTIGGKNRTGGFSQTGRKSEGEEDRRN